MIKTQTTTKKNLIRLKNKTKNLIEAIKHMIYNNKKNKPDITKKSQKRIINKTQNPNKE